MNHTLPLETLQVSYITVGESKGHRRIWLEGGRLHQAGFVAGAHFRVVMDESRNILTLALDDWGNRVVSGRKRPGGSHASIIDLVNDDISRFMGKAQRVRVRFTRQRIFITIHHEDRKRLLREARLRLSLQQQVLKTGTLCAGAGISTAALHEGFEATGLETVCEWVVDLDARYLEIADRNNPAIQPKTRLIVGSIEEIEAELLPAVDVLNVSLPCDIHSKAGKSKKKLATAEEDATITSVFGLLNVVRFVQPAVIVSENVKEAQFSAAYLMIKAELHRQGYVLNECILDDRHAGSIERRERYWFVAISSGLGDVQLGDLPALPRQFATVADLLEPIPETSDQFRHFAYLDAKELRDKAAGKGFRQQIIDTSAISVGTIGKHYQKARSTEPRLKGVDGMSRLFTVREHCRLKGIPESLLADTGATIGHEAAGQSILWHHATSIGRRIGLALSALPLNPGQLDQAA